MNYWNIDTTPKHKTFISFHHADEYYKSYFERNFGESMDGFVSQAVSDGDINDNLPTDRIRQIIRDEFIREATVTVVLIGNETWKRKHVDWEISSSIRDTVKNSRTGLLGIILPNYTINDYFLERKYSENGGVYAPNTIPPRLYKNVLKGFAKVYSWSNDVSNIKNWIHEAFNRRNQVIPDNSYPSFANNRSESQTNWQ
ncbi:MAG: TIR domain-containing protein [Candidatus Delongbacteria bacterium]|jgi:hypothetical protein